MKKLAAIVTDAVSADFYFPLFHRYYSHLFGAENIFIITGHQFPSAFADFVLGGVFRFGTYNNNDRCSTVSALTSLLLQTYKFVLHVDTDEFLVADPRKFLNLRHFLETDPPAYVTAMGYNVVSQPSDSPLERKRPILANQRPFCCPYDALNKTCITSIPLTWAPGFHFASVWPAFSDVFLFHLKYADIDMQLSIGAMVAAESDQPLFQEYHASSRQKLEAMMASIFSFPTASGWPDFVRTEYNRRFISAVRYVSGFGGVYHGGEFQPETIRLAIPDEFAACL